MARIEEPPERESLDNHRGDMGTARGDASSPMVGRCSHERRLIRSMGRYRNPYGAAPGVARGFHMNLRVTITIKFEIAATAYGLAALLWLLS
jgi:hypothetical protein